MFDVFVCYRVHLFFCVPLSLTEVLVFIALVVAVDHAVVQRHPDRHSVNGGHLGTLGHHPAKKRNTADTAQTSAKNEG